MITYWPMKYLGYLWIEQLNGGWIRNCWGLFHPLLPFYSTKKSLLQIPNTFMVLQRTEISWNIKILNSTFPDIIKHSKNFIFVHDISLCVRLVFLSCSWFWFLWFLYLGAIPTLLSYVIILFFSLRKYISKIRILFLERWFWNFQNQIPKTINNLTRASIFRNLFPILTSPWIYVTI